MNTRNTVYSYIDYCIIYLYHNYKATFADPCTFHFINIVKDLPSTNYVPGTFLGTDKIAHKSVKKKIPVPIGLIF